jgi:hypothetical protein
MRKRILILSAWGVAYALLVSVSAQHSLQTAVLPALFLLFVPQFFFCLRATRRIIHLIRTVYPEHWTALSRGMELRLFLFDERTLGDATIAAWKQQLRWWMRAGIIGAVLFLPTLLLIEKLSK